MKAAGLIAIVLSIAAANLGPAERTVFPRAAAPTIAAPSAAAPTAAAPTATSVSQLPILFVVDGVRYSGDQVPLLSAELVASVQVVSGRRALERYGPDASYGVVVITTKLASTRQS